MVQFCPHCHNILLIREIDERTAFFCQTCPFIQKLNEKIVKVTELTPKKPEEAQGDMNEIASAKVMGMFKLHVSIYFIILTFMNKCKILLFIFFQPYVLSAQIQRHISSNYKYDLLMNL